MNLNRYFEDTYEILKIMFTRTGHVNNSVVIGGAREYLALQVLSIFPEKKRTGWIVDPFGNETGQIDIIAVLPNAVTLPEVLSDCCNQSGSFSTQVYSAIEIKSSISSEISQIISKTWECHRLKGGFGNSSSFETVNNEQYRIDWPEYMPVCVIGGKGFKGLQTYEDHFRNSKKLNFRVNGKDISPPGKLEGAIPELLLDIENGSLLIRNELKPEIIESALKIKGEKGEFVTYFNGISGGYILGALIYYLDIARNSLASSQRLISAPILDGLMSSV